MTELFSTVVLKFPYNQIVIATNMTKCSHAPRYMTHPPSPLLSLRPPFLVIVGLQDLGGETVGLSRFGEVGGGVTVIRVGVVVEARGEEVRVGCGKAWTRIGRVLPDYFLEV